MAVVTAGALVVTEATLKDLRQFWIGHPIFAALVASAVVLGITVLLVDEVLRRRHVSRWKMVAQTAFRELSTDAFRAWVIVMTRLGFPEADERFFHVRELLANADQADLVGAPAILAEDFEDVVDEAITHPEFREAMATVIYDETEALGTSVARWAPIMLQDGDLAEGLDLFSDMRDALIGAGNGFRAASADPNWRWGFWVSLDFFFLLFGKFDSLRQDALGDPTMFRGDEAEMRRTWGLPADRPVPPGLSHSD